MIFQCKMCGGDLEVDDNCSTGVCAYCGTQQTIPRLDDERVMNLFNRANHYRMRNDFENAMVAYQNIINEDPDNAEAYWGLCLCRYGIEYVKDPSTDEMIPTCHRTQFDSILEDEDYLSAYSKADSVAKSLYEKEAEHIDEIQKKILEISSKEEDYDVFICYKEADEHGERTPDSVIGQEIYDALTDKGMRVFFARISLESKIGSAYEPYIFAALHSAKVMITVGTKPEYMNAVWVKNEWSRFLSIMKKGIKKTLIPVYKEMSPYDMPEVFANIQAVNMEKLGALQDLVRGIEKILGKSEATRVKQKVVEKIVHVEEKNGSTSSFVPLLERAQMYLEDSEWDKADEYAERVLDMNPKCGEAYLVKLLAGFKFNHISKLSQLQQSLDSVKEYKKICQFGSEELKKQVQSYNDQINKQLVENKKKEVKQELEGLEMEKKKLLQAIEECTQELERHTMGRSELSKQLEEKKKENEKNSDLLKRQEALLRKAEGEYDGKLDKFVNTALIIGFGVPSIAALIFLCIFGYDMFPVAVAIAVVGMLVLLPLFSIIEKCCDRCHAKKKKNIEEEVKKIKDRASSYDRTINSFQRRTSAVDNKITQIENRMDKERQEIRLLEKKIHHANDLMETLTEGQLPDIDFQDHNDPIVDQLKRKKQQELTKLISHVAEIKSLKSL